MSGSLNKVQLIGHLGGDPQITNLPEGGRVASFSIATSDKWTDRESGEQRERVEWSRVSIFSEPLVALAEKYLRKGSRIYLEGSLQTRKWDDNGTTRYATDVVLRPYNGEIKMLDAPKSAPASEPTRSAPRANARRNAPTGPRAA